MSIPTRSFDEESMSTDYSSDDQLSPSNQPESRWTKTFLSHFNVAPDTLDNYLCAYVPSSSEPPTTTIQPDIFSECSPEERDVPKMCQNLISTLNRLSNPKGIPRSRLLKFAQCTHVVPFPFAKHSSDHAETYPNVVVSFPGKVIGRTTQKLSWDKISMVLNVKSSDENDPFSKKEKDPDDILTLIDLASCARNLFIAHGFLAAFIMAIFGDIARIVRFDHAGAVVSQAFAYRKRPEVLQRFFWRFVRPCVGDTVVGCDPAVRKLTVPDMNWVKKCLKQLKRVSIPSDKQLLKGRRVTVPASSKASDSRHATFVLFDVIDIKTDLFGGSSMVWLAFEDMRLWDQAAGANVVPQLVVCKEAWCSILRVAESAIYKRLRYISDDEVTGLPRMLYGADVGNKEVEAWVAADGSLPRYGLNSYDESGRDSASPSSPSRSTPSSSGISSEDCKSISKFAHGHNGNCVYQKDRTHRSPSYYAGSSAEFPLPYPQYQTHTWRILHGDKYNCRERSLVRLVVDIVGRPLVRFRSTRELVEAMRDAIRGHQQAWDVGVLHRDISDGNILIAEYPKEGLRGFLHDFDNSWKTALVPWGDTPDASVWLEDGEDAEEISPHSGTFLFMSINLLEDDWDTVVHTLHHDLEAFYWVLLSIVLRRVRHEYLYRGELDEDEEEHEDTYSMVFTIQDDAQYAAEIKRLWLSHRRHGLTVLNNEPLTDLLGGFSELIWGRLYRHRVCLNAPAPLTHASILDVFEIALARMDWPDESSDGPLALEDIEEEDEAEDQDQGDQSKTELEGPSYSSSHDSAVHKDGYISVGVDLKRQVDVPYASRRGSNSSQPRKKARLRGVGRG